MPDLEILETSNLEPRTWNLERKRIDFGRHSDDYAIYRPGPPASFYERIDGITRISDSRALDLATGPGMIAIELAARGGSIVGIDISAEQIATARRVAKERKLDHRASFNVARAEATSLDENSFDMVIAGQCWHWFDREAAMTEVLRVLRPGGVLVVVHYSYLARHAPVASDTEDLILEFNPAWTMAGWTGLFPEEIDEVIEGGFEFVETFCYDYDESFSHARWRGRMRTCNGVGSGGLPPARVKEFDEALSRLLRDRYPDPMDVKHRVWCVVARKPD
jgi:SAM-dependent methyltransferase